MATRYDPPPGRRRTSRPATVLALVVVLGTAALLWAADGLSRVGAQTLVARAVQQQSGAEQRPAVRVQGLALLPQTVRGRYDEVHVDLPSVEAGPLRLTGLHADLRGVRLSFHDVLVQDVHRITVERATQDAVLRWDDLNRYLRLTSRPVSAAPGGPAGGIRLTASVRALGRTVTTTAGATLAADEEGIAIRPTGLGSGAASLDRATRLLLGQRFTIRIPLQALPFGEQVTDIAARPDGLHVRATGTGIRIQD